jgi:hypothetical protein
LRELKKKKRKKRSFNQHLSVNYLKRLEGLRLKRKRRKRKKRRRLRLWLRLRVGLLLLSKNLIISKTLLALLLLMDSMEKEHR